MPTLSIKKEWRDQMKKKMIIYSWENSLRCLFEVKSDNVIPWSRNNQHPGGMRMILSNLRRAFPRLAPGAGLYQPSLVVVAVTAGALSNADVNRQSQILHIMRSYYLEKQGLIAKITVSSPPPLSKAPNNICLSFTPSPRNTRYYHHTLSEPRSYLLDMVQIFSFL